MMPERLRPHIRFREQPSGTPWTAPEVAWALCAFGEFLILAALLWRYVR